VNEVNAVCWGRLVLLVRPPLRVCAVLRGNRVRRVRKVHPDLRGREDRRASLDPKARRGLPALKHRAAAKEVRERASRLFLRTRASLVSATWRRHYATDDQCRDGGERVSPPPGIAPGLVAELFRAANKIQSVSAVEQSWLLRSAAYEIQKMRAKVTHCGRPSDMQPAAIASGLLAIADAPQTFTPKAVALALLHAAYVIKTLESMVECRAEPTEGSA
jgi:hypothetical protein